MRSQTFNQYRYVRLLHGTIKIHQLSNLKVLNDRQWLRYGSVSVLSMNYITYLYSSVCVLDLKGLHYVKMRDNKNS